MEFSKEELDEIKASVIFVLNSDNPESFDNDHCLISLAKKLGVTNDDVWYDISKLKLWSEWDVTYSD